MLRNAVRFKQHSTARVVPVTHLPQLLGLSTCVQAQPLSSWSSSSRTASLTCHTTLRKIVVAKKENSETLSIFGCSAVMNESSPSLHGFQSRPLNVIRCQLVARTPSNIAPDSPAKLRCNGVWQVPKTGTRLNNVELFAARRRRQSTSPGARCISHDPVRVAWHERYRVNASQAHGASQVRHPVWVIYAIYNCVVQSNVPLKCHPGAARCFSCASPKLSADPTSHLRTWPGKKSSPFAPIREVVRYVAHNSTHVQHPQCPRGLLRKTLRRVRDRVGALALCRNLAPTLLEAHVLCLASSPSTSVTAHASNCSPPET